MYKQILLLFNENKNLENIDFKEFQFIVAFDEETSDILTRKNIEHIISERFLTEDDFEFIQMKSYEFAKWFEIDKISDKIKFRNVNLGSLIYIEFYILLIPILKRIREIQKILNQFTQNKIFASDSLKNILQNFERNCTYLSPTNNTIESFFYDNINLEIKGFSVPISYQKYIALKNIWDRFLGFLFIHNKRNQNDILLVEFNTLKYKKLIESLFKKNFTMAYYGIRRPAIWNFTTFQIIKNNHVNFTEKLWKSKNTNLINEINIFDSIIKNLLEDNNFVNYFSFFEINIFKTIKPNIEKLFLNRLHELIYNIDAIEKYLDEIKPKMILLLSESGTTEKIIIQLSKTLGIKTILLQHGLFNDDKKAHNYNIFTGSVLKESDEFLVWGNSMMKYVQKYMIPENKTHIVGSCIHDSYFDISSKSEKHILLIAQGPSIRLQVKDYTLSASKEYKKIIHEICNISKNHGEKLIIKLHGYEKDNGENLIASKFPNVKVIKGGDATNYITSAKVIVSLGTSTSTAILESHILRKPVIRINYGEWVGKSDAIRKISCHHIDISELDDTLRELKNDRKFKDKILKIGKEFLDEYLFFQGSAAEKTSEFLLKYEFNNKL